MQSCMSKHPELYENEDDTMAEAANESAKTTEEPLETKVEQKDKNVEQKESNNTT